MKKTILATCLFFLTLWASVSAAAHDEVTVDSVRFEASVVCADGRISVTHHVSLAVPQGDAYQFFSPPGPLVDPYSIDWEIRDVCRENGGAVVRFDVRNITDDGFVVQGTIRGAEHDGATFSLPVANEQTTVPLGGGARLVVRRVALVKRAYPDANEAVKAARAAAPAFD